MTAKARRMTRNHVLSLVGTVFAVGVSACGRTPYHCDSTHPCDLAMGSVCAADNLCAVREGECPSGYAYDRSTLHPGTCVPRMVIDNDASSDGTGSDGGDITPTDAQDIVDVTIPPCPVPRPISPLSVSRTSSNHVRLVVRVDPAAGPATAEFEMGLAREPFAAVVSMPAQSVASDVASAMVNPLAGSHFWRVRTHCTNTGLTSDWSPVWEFVAPHRDAMTITHNTALPGPLDINGDGLADLAVGIPGLHAVAIYLGPIASPPSTPIVVTGADAFGSVVATAGDLNGDGFSDLLVGACPAQDEGSATRTCGDAVTVVFGNSAGAVQRTQSISGPTMLPFDGGTGSFGTSVSGAGDLNGDGYGDFVVGTAFPPSVGSAVVYFGGTTVPSVPGIVIANPDPAHVGFGSAVAGLGDGDDDGLSDIAVGGLDLIAVYHGNRSPTAFASQMVVPVALPAGSTNLGVRLASAGDVDGDGIGDILAGDPNAANPHAVLFRGGATLASAPVFAYIPSHSAMDATGASIAGGDDLNNDGFDDFVVGSPEDAAGVGIARTFSGRANGADPMQTVVSPATGSQARFGAAVAMVGALDGHVGSFAIGAPGYTLMSAPVGNGTAYVYNDHSAAMPAPAVALSALFLMPEAPVGAGFGRSLAQASNPASARLNWLLGLSTTAPF